MKRGEQRGTQEFARRIVVAFAERTGKFERGFAISRPGSASHGEQLVGDLGHRADHNHGSLCQSSVDDFRRAIDCIAILHRGPAELHHDHRETFLGKAAAST